MSPHLNPFTIQLIDHVVKRPISLIMLEAVVFLGTKTMFLKPIPPGRQPQDVLRNSIRSSIRHYLISQVGATGIIIVLGHSFTRTMAATPIVRAATIRRWSRSLKATQAPRELNPTTAMLMVGNNWELCHPGTPSALMRK